MEKNKNFFSTSSILITLISLTGIFSLSLMIFSKLKISQAQTSESVKVIDTSATVETQQRLEQLKTTMLTTWQKEAQAKGLAADVPQRFQGVTIDEAKIPATPKIVALTFDD